MFTTDEIEAEARALYEDYRRQKPHAVGGAVLPAWDGMYAEEVKDAWRAAAKGSLERRASSLPPSLRVPPIPLSQLVGEWLFVGGHWRRIASVNDPSGKATVATEPSLPPPPK